MMGTAFVLDSCAVIALLKKESGGEKVREILRNSQLGDTDVIMHKLNLLEVYYGFYREQDKSFADAIVKRITKIITIIPEISDEIFTEAGRLKASYKISLADSIALAEASVSGRILLTADHHEFDIVEKNEKIHFQWIR